ncbi:MAG: hypothetical protein M0C28_00070 [Candidatus Moduliflexus flocculans]|nr:hypothetical protein [Candidatus Moduliflexus flocculans]
MSGSPRPACFGVLPEARNRPPVAGKHPGGEPRGLLNGLAFSGTSQRYGVYAKKSLTGALGESEAGGTLRPGHAVPGHRRPRHGRGFRNPRVPLGGKRHGHRA